MKVVRDISIASDVEFRKIQVSSYLEHEELRAMWSKCVRPMIGYVHMRRGLMMDFYWYPIATLLTIVRVEDDRP